MTRHYELQRDRVIAGAKLLDERRPGWFRDIEVGTLDLVDPNACILGQLFVDEVMGSSYVYGYDAGQAALLEAGEEPCDYGFNLDYAEVGRNDEGDSIPIEPELWEELYDLWIEQIKFRYMNSVD